MTINKQQLKKLLSLIEQNPSLLESFLQNESNNISLREYIKRVWPIIDGSKYIHNWHIDCLADHLEALYQRQIKKLIICIPPRMGKSQICSVAYPTWVWTKDPSTQIYTASYSKELCDRDAWRSRLLIQSSWYQKRWGDLFTLAQDSNRKNFYHNDKNGYRLALSTQSGSTGHGYHLLIIDDPHKATDVTSRAKREAVINWYTDAMSTRANDSNAIQIVIGQRLHHKDLIGFLIEQGDWEIIKLPMEYVPTNHITAIGWQDPRTVPRELLFPARFSREDVNKLKANLRTPSNIAAQLQQEPTPEEGSIIQRNWIKHWTVKPKNYDRFVLSFDFSMGGDIVSIDNSYAAGVVILEHNDNYFVLDAERVQSNFSEQIKLAERLYTRYKEHISHIIIEAEAAGKAIESILKEKIKDANLVLFKPNQLNDKIHRLELCLDLFESGRVLFPDQEYIYSKWYAEFIDELLKFPKAANDDQVDALVQGLLWLRLNKTGKQIQMLYEHFMENNVKPLQTRTVKLNKLDEFQKYGYDEFDKPFFKKEETEEDVFIFERLKDYKRVKHLF